MGKKALLVIDVQEAMFAYSDFPVYRAEELLKNIGELIENARRHDVPIIFVRHNDEDMVFGSALWQVHKRLNAFETDIYVNKQKPDSFFETNLKEELEREEIEEIYICGMQTEYCVDTTCRSAVSKKINAFLVDDAHSTYDSPVLKAEQIISHHNSVLGGSFVKLVPTLDVVF